MLRYNLKWDVLSAFGIYWALAVVFGIAYLLPLRIWIFGSHIDTFGSGTQLHRRVMAYPYVCSDFNLNDLDRKRRLIIVSNFCLLFV